MKEALGRDAYRLLVLGEGARIPFADESFGSVTSTSVLEHIAEIEPVLREAARILKVGGKFVFCGPNHRFPRELWGRRVLRKIGLRGLGSAYGRFFNWISRHAHTDAPEVWAERLDDAGFDLVDTWDYFPPKALYILEWGHPLGMPSWICKQLFGRWILVPKRWNLAIPWKLTRKYLDHARSEEGVCSFYIARKR
jgi:SAM-dependent methyltransferase